MPPAFGPKSAVQQGDNVAGGNDGRAVAADDQAGGLAALLAPEPPGYQGHGGDVGKAAPQADKSVQGGQGNKTVCPADSEGAEANEEQAGNNREAGAKPSDEHWRHDHGQEIADEVGRADVPHPVVGETEGTLHPRQEHGVGVAGKAEAGEEHQAAGGDNDPAVMEGSA